MSDSGGELRLQLSFPLVAENGPRFADEIVEQGRSQGLALDYSAASLALIDSIIASLRNEGVSPDRVADVLFGFGSYLGEAIARATGGRWISITDARDRPVSTFPIVVELPDGTSCNALDQPFTALLDGERASLARFFERYVSTSL